MGKHLHALVGAAFAHECSGCGYVSSTVPVLPLVCVSAVVGALPNAI